VAVRCNAALCCAVLLCAVQADKEIGAVKVSRLNMVDLAGSEKTTKVCSDIPQQCCYTVQQCCNIPKQCCNTVQQCCNTVQQFCNLVQHGPAAEHCGLVLDVQ
jgi:hypothetical protein